MPSKRSLLGTCLDLAANLFYAAILVSKFRFAQFRCREIKDYFNAVQTIRVAGGIASLSNLQKKKEIVSFLEKAVKLPVHAVCEIGTGQGGTTYLLTRIAEPDATLITIDTMNDWNRKIVLRCLARTRQKMHVLIGDSTDPETVERVAKILGKLKLDLLFIDGDHAYDAVSRDFEVYSKFVRKGGWIALHDVIQDYRSRFGVPTQAYVGGVPTFWNQIKGRFRNFEIVEDLQQDGYGIGIVEL